MLNDELFSVNIFWLRQNWWKIGKFKKKSTKIVFFLDLLMSTSTEHSLLSHIHLARPILLTSRKVLIMKYFRKFIANILHKFCFLLLFVFHRLSVERKKGVQTKAPWTTQQAFDWNRWFCSCFWCCCISSNVRSVGIQTCRPPMLSKLIGTLHHK